jgi:hypothetical protein
MGSGQLTRVIGLHAGDSAMARSEKKIGWLPALTCMII